MTELLFHPQPITTRSGIQFRWWDPQPEQIDLGDIAHALANKCRWSGHTRGFYSVAQHSCHVYDLICQGGFALQGRLLHEVRLFALLHDAAEAYLPDVAQPIKAHMPALQQWERKIQVAVAQRFGIRAQGGDIDLYHWADEVALVTEGRDLMPTELNLSSCLATPDPTPIHYGFCPDVAKQMFLNRAHTELAYLSELKGVEHVGAVTEEK